MLVELLLQLFVCVVDTQLLERILGEDLKAKNIQQADERQLTLLAFLGCRRFCSGPFRLFSTAATGYRDRGIDFLHDPAKNNAVEVLAERVTRLVDLLYRDGRLKHLLADDLTLHCDGVDELGHVDAEQPGHRRDVVS